MWLPRRHDSTGGLWLSLYSASKAFAYSFSCALAFELKGERRYCARLFCPGGTRTEFQDRAGMKHNEGLFGPMTAREVAEIGYHVLEQGRPVVIGGMEKLAHDSGLATLPDDVDGARRGES